MMYSHVFNHGDFSLGYKLESDLPKFGLTSAGATLLWKNGAYDFWGRGQFLRKVFGVGGTYRMNKDAVMSSELLYDLKEGKGKGIMGSPLFWKYGATHKCAG